jgi:hypothetical protein
VNFFVRTQPEATDLVQELPGLDAFGGVQYRRNILQEFFFVSRVNQEWVGTGYTVYNARNGIGTLYRYQTKLHVRDTSILSDPAGMVGEFLFQRDDIPNTNRLTRVADGVIHFQVNAYRTNGFLAAPYDEFGFPWSPTNIFTADYPNKQGLFYEFYDDALPTAVEIELAVVEPDVLERLEALPSVPPNEDIRRNYLKEQAGKVHVFKQRVPIRRVDTDAYK